jgi:hypothetical protein
MASSTSGSLIWTPTLFQRGTYQFTISGTDGTANAAAQTVTVTVRAGYTGTNLISALDALNATNASGLSASTPSAPFTSAATAGNWLNLFSSASNGALTFGTTNPWGGTGQSSTSTVDPYTLTFNHANSDSLSLGPVLNASAQFSTETWVKPSPLPSASPAPIIIGNGGANGNGFVLRQSKTNPDRAEFIIGQKYYSYQDLILSDKPIGYWRLGETSGTTATDLSAFENHGTYTGSFIQGKPGIISGDSNTSTQFDGSTSYVSMGNVTALNNLSTVTLSAWIKPTNFTSRGTVVAKEGTCKVDVITDGTVRFLTGNDWAGGILTSSTVLTLNNWHHIVATYDGTVKKLFINGVQDASVLSTTGALATTTNPLLVGAYYNAAVYSSYFIGNIDDVSIYNYALTPTQITEHYQTGLNGNYKSYPGNTILADQPVGYWRLNEKSGITAKDFSGNGYDGTLAATGVTQNQPGALTGAGDSDASASFSGSIGTVEIPYNANLNTSVFSAEIWAKATGGAGTHRSPMTQRNIAGGGPYAYGFMVYAGMDNTWTASVGDGITASGTGWKNIIGPAVILNTWNHLVLTYDGTKASLYVNGTLVGTNTTPYAPNTSRPLRIGAGATEGVGTYYFNGSLDEAALYDYPLSATQIAAHYNSGQGAGWWICQAQVNSNQWNLLSTLYDGTTAKLFLNGQQECSVTPGTTYSNTAANTVIGSNPGRTSGFWQGLLSSIKIFGTGNGTAPATSTTIKTNFDSEANRYRYSPVENIVTNGMLFNLDPANAKQGIAPYSNGCATSGLNWFDLSEQFFHGTLFGFTSCGASKGWVGSGTTADPYALAFSSADSTFVSLPMSTSSINTADTTFTVSGWFKSSGTAANTIISQGGTGVTGINGWGLHLNFFSQGSISAFIKAYSGAQTVQIVSTNTYNDGVWHHFAAVFTTNTTSYLANNIVVYIDGSLVSGVVSYQGGGAPYGGNPNLPIYLGARGTLTSRNSFLDGSLGTVQMYNRGLTHQEVKQNCLAQEGRFAIIPQSKCEAP